MCLQMTFMEEESKAMQYMQYKQRVFEKNTEAAWVAAFTCLCIYVHVETSTVCGHIGIYNYGP